MTSERRLVGIAITWNEGLNRNGVVSQSGGPLGAFWGEGTFGDLNVYTILYIIYIYIY